MCDTPAAAGTPVVVKDENHSIVYRVPAHLVVNFLRGLDPGAGLDGFEIMHGGTVSFGDIVSFELEKIGHAEL